MFTPDQHRRAWPGEHSAALKRLVDAGNSYSEAASALNAEFGTSYTRNACIGRGHRLAIAQVVAPAQSPEERRRLDNKRRREKNWAENPNIVRRYGREKVQKDNRALFIARGASTTSAEYRRHVPRLPRDMTRADLRAMLTQAVQNTAAMVIA